MTPAVEWCAGQWGREPTPAEALLIDVVCAGFATGPHNIRALRRGQIRQFGRGAAICHSGDLASWDRDALTRLVFAAHDRCARVEVAPAGFYLRIVVHARTREPGDRPIMRGHPTLEQAVAKWRKYHPLGETQ